RRAVRRQDRGMRRGSRLAARAGDRLSWPGVPAVADRRSITQSSPPPPGEDPAMPSLGVATPALADPEGSAGSIVAEAPGRYLLQQELSRGGQGIVHLAYDNQLGR